jgi:transposase
LNKLIQRLRTVFEKKEKSPPKISVTKRHIYICDQGHYGSTTCGNCGADVTEHLFQCPQCGFWFERDNDVSKNEGGQDYY